MSSNTQFFRVAQRLREEYETRFFRRLRDITKPHERKVTTGFAELDAALGIGGLPRGCITEVVRAPTGGGLTFVLALATAAQKRGEIVAWLDCAALFDADRAFHHGLDVETVTVVRPPTLTAALSVATTLVLHGSVHLVVVDALPALCATGAWAHTLGVGMRRLQRALTRRRAVALFLTEAASGGYLDHEAAVRLELVRQRWLRRRGDVVGVQSRVTVTRNRFARTPVGVTLKLPFAEEVDR